MRQTDNKTQRRIFMCFVVPEEIFISIFDTIFEGHAGEQPQPTTQCHKCRVFECPPERGERRKKKNRDFNLF